MATSGTLRSQIIFQVTEYNSNNIKTYNNVKLNTTKNSTKSAETSKSNIWTFKLFSLWINELFYVQITGQYKYLFHLKLEYKTKSILFHSDAGGFASCWKKSGCKNIKYSKTFSFKKWKIRKTFPRTFICKLLLKTKSLGLTSQSRSAVSISPTLNLVNRKDKGLLPIVLHFPPHRLWRNRIITFLTDCGAGAR